MNDDKKELNLAQTPLNNLHKELGATMVEFAGYEMPMSYPTGVLHEHQHTRDQASLFDVSHMGQVKLTGKNAAVALETLLPGNIVGLKPFHQRYSVFTNDLGGILDDLIVTNIDDHLLLVFNAACKKQIINHLRKQLSGSKCSIEVLEDHALLALQGPAAHLVLSRFIPDVTTLKFMRAAWMNIDDTRCLITRCGYTGEDGFEILVPADRALKITLLLLDQTEVAPAGLGARDTLRLEAGFCLYGQDIDTTTTPIEASLEWTVSKVRRLGGDRPGGYPGAKIINKQLTEGITRKLVGFSPQSKSPVRKGTKILDSNKQVVGHVTSGGFGPTLGLPLAMGYVDSTSAYESNELTATLRGKPISMIVTFPPFVPHRYYYG